VSEASAGHATAPAPPWLTLVIPFHNPGAKLEVCLQGLTAQGLTAQGSLEGVELVFVDDGSTDGSGERVLAWGAEVGAAMGEDARGGSRPRLHLERLETNAGVSAARNRGLTRATAPHVLFLDADDTLTHGALAGLWAGLRAAPAPAADLHLFEFRAFDGADAERARRVRFVSSESHEVDPGEALEAYLSGGWVKRVHLGSTVFRTAFLRAQALTFDPALAYGEDQRFLIGALSHAGRVVWDSAILLGYLNHADSATGVFSWRGFEVHAMMAGLRNDPSFTRYLPVIERRMNRLLVGLLNHHLDHFGVRKSLRFLEDEIRPRVVAPRGVRLRLAFMSLPLYAALWWGYARVRRLNGVQRLNRIRRLKGVRGFAGLVLGLAYLGAGVGLPGGPEGASAQIGTRELAPAIVQSVPAVVRASATDSDARMAAGDLAGALAALFGGPGALPQAVSGGAAPSVPDLGALRGLARPGDAHPGAGSTPVRVGGEPLPAPTGSYELAWRAARLGMAKGVLAPTDGERGRWHRWGVIWGAEAVLLDPNPRGTESRFWLLANLGRLALEGLPATERGRASEALFDLAQAILAEDPGQPGAHIILGRNHLEIRSLNLATRTLARVAFGNEFVNRSTFEGALHHLERGARADPGMLYFQMEWAHGLAARGERDRARQIWERVLTLPDRLPIDTALKAEARRRLAER
jgi:glycosyltransferase involved in cell wall biosynthesis